MNAPHVPVLVEPILVQLDIQPNDVVLDGTLGFGGHAREILAKLGPEGRYIGVDQDPDALAYCKEAFKEESRLSFLHSNFAQVDQKLGSIQLDKVLLDLGMSSFHLDSSGRGFSFQKDEPLDMRMNPTLGKTARDVLMTYDAQALSDLFFHYGDLHHNKRLVEAVISARKASKQALRTTVDLVGLIRASYNGSRPMMMKISSQVFQALRIEVNQEFNVLEKALSALVALLKPEGRMAVITFHSGEDRLVKQFVKRHLDILEPLTKHVIQATQDEIRQNSRSKPAKLRVFKKKVA